MMKQEVKVENMTCDGCANTVKMRFEGVPGVSAVDINLDEKLAVLEVEEHVSEKVLADALDGTNYNLVK